MATLTEAEKEQLCGSLKSVTHPPRTELRPVAEYLAFLRFIARSSPPPKARPISGANWRL